MTTASPDLTRIRCLNHGDREAVARCPGCHSYFCRECVIEHEGRMICASCLQAESQVSEKKSRSFRGLKSLGKILSAVFAFGVAWLFFMLVGRMVIWSKVGFDWLGNQ
ncbi:rhomboid family protein [Kiritimatiellota bacterium B12222]|nr:rhomboid family protein [Kiritimatiellota bacterium B12222]